MQINNKNNLSISRINNEMDNSFIDLNKHYPFFKLFDLTNNKDLKGFTKDRYINTFGVKKNSSHYYYKNINDYNKAHLTVFLNNARNPYLNNYSKDSEYYLRNVLDNLCNYTSLRKLNYRGFRTIIYSTYTLNIKDSYIFMLCIKQEYIYYVKLCLLTGNEIEFDCFYMLVRKNGKDLVNTTIESRMYNTITNAIKHYGCKLIYVDSIEKEVLNQVYLPKFNTMKDYSNWLINIKDNFLKSFKTDPIHEELPF